MNAENRGERIQCSGKLKEKTVVMVQGCLRCSGLRGLKIAEEADIVQCVACGTAWSVGREETKIVLTVME